MSLLLLFGAPAAPETFGAVSFGGVGTFSHVAYYLKALSPLGIRARYLMGRGLVAPPPRHRLR
jgi:hypothetical protein